jgi:hypothetical protein
MQVNAAKKTDGCLQTILALQFVCLASLNDR